MGEWFNVDPEAVINQSLQTGGGTNVSDAYKFNGLPGLLYNSSTKGKAKENDELSLRIANHSFTVVEADAGYVKLFETNTLIDNTQTNHKCSVENQTRASNVTFFMLARPYATGMGTFDNSIVAGILEYEHQPLTSLKNRPLLRPWFPAINATNLYPILQANSEA
ncbi:hypothetical protein V6N13_000958 [Hibiscus sabdariffa]|uniref:Plastocyanin-like domain-containing protein n=1 Tax=Hibiscus sabdariffa TaxID=183260 RepID=A0ABR2G6T7_9ROSI